MSKTYKSTKEPEYKSFGNNQMYNPDTVIFQHADKYYQALSTGDQDQVTDCRQQLFHQLSVYCHCLDTNEPPRDSWTALQLTIRYASAYAKTYVKSGDYSSSEVVNVVRQNMVEEGRRLPYGVAEWIVQHVKSRSTNQRGSMEEMQDGFTGFADEELQQRIKFNTESLDTVEE